MQYSNVQLILLDCFFIAAIFARNKDKSGEMFITFIYAVFELLPTRDFLTPFRRFLDHWSPRNEIGMDDFTEIYGMYLSVQSSNFPMTQETFTQEEMRGEYKSIDKTRWGSVFWKLLHLVSVNLGTYVSKKQIKDFKTMLISLYYVIPCGMCSEHFLGYLTINKVSENTSPKRYIYDLHNSVNDRIVKESNGRLEAGKPFPIADLVMYKI